MRHLLTLLNSNRGRGTGTRIVRAEDGSETATVYVYGAIGEHYGVDPQQFVRDLQGVTAATLHLRINSPGGDVFGARAMKTALEQHGATVVAHIDGLAASAASFLMLAASEIEIAAGAFVMIHEPWSFALGTADDLRASADLLDKVGLAIAADYVRRTGEGEAEILALMKAETWFDADEAVAIGLATRKAEAPAVENAFDLGAFRNPPRALTNPPPKPFEAAAADHSRYAARLRLYERAA
ncbi:head maturation protease, ClpP-related [Methylobacterium oryzihabitans]|uniref:ATP-dependent Clp protease proteolytic subunit n=1 Tax=Methylobacterium oryzihabitans TaxID=2499852 RepID=A0A3S2YR28_9HYPH|nr:head maturation protease, ClpP-related [Methylobacterium oryzihabitans]RVU17489.1 Clp protease ClpP [Methylobacterium oryzihabitans]